MELAKQQAAEREGQDDTASDETKKAKLSDKEIKEQNDRRRFDELLKSSSVSVSGISSDGYLSKQQEDLEIDALRKGIDLLFEGDPAPTDVFDGLVAPNDNILGEAGTKRIVPWLRESSDYLIVISDPRVKSLQLRDVVKTIVNELPRNLLSRTIVINSDSPSENRRLIKKNIPNSSLLIYSDEKKEWMRDYTALGEDRWSMTMFVLADGRLQKIARDLDTTSASKTIQNAVNAMEKRRL